jgi:hypothetical protein
MIFVVVAINKQVLLAKRIAISVSTAQSASHQTQLAIDRSQAEEIHFSNLVDPSKLRQNGRAP